MTQRKKETHESYGLLQFSRTTRSQETTLFGSSIPHKETIRLRISPANIERSLSHEYINTGEEGAIIEAELSLTQFAEAISSLNLGSGIPITIRRLNGKGIEEPEFISKRRLYEQEFDEKMKSLADKLSDLTKQSNDILTNKKSINKADREVIQKGIESLVTEIKSNITYMASAYNEQLDKTTLEAKGEIEASISNRINQLGLQSLQQLLEIGQNSSEQLQIKQDK